MLISKINSIGVNLLRTDIKFENKRLLDKSIAELDTFTKQELPLIEKSNQEAISKLEEIANNLNALLENK